MKRFTKRLFVIGFVSALLLLTLGVLSGCSKELSTEDAATELQLALEKSLSSDVYSYKRIELTPLTAGGKYNGRNSVLTSEVNLRGETDAQDNIIREIGGEPKDYKLRIYDYTDKGGIFEQYYGKTGANFTLSTREGAVGKESAFDSQAFVKTTSNLKVSEFVQTSPYKETRSLAAQLSELKSALESGVCKITAAKRQGEVDTITLEFDADYIAANRATTMFKGGYVDENGAPLTKVTVEIEVIYDRISSIVVLEDELAEINKIPLMKAQREALSLYITYYGAKITLP
ncbi:MAG: hypothetical protein LBN25_00010 [Christensenellaceae bacterium]|jgi:hypothetical protein|nr:hypothetical protein [Christensenellaceae bacterium]